MKKIKLKNVIDHKSGNPICIEMPVSEQEYEQNIIPFRIESWKCGCRFRLGLNLNDNNEQ